MFGLIQHNKWMLSLFYQSIWSNARKELKNKATFPITGSGTWRKNYFIANWIPLSSSGVGGPSPGYEYGHLCATTNSNTTSAKTVHLIIFLYNFCNRLLVEPAWYCHHICTRAMINISGKCYHWYCSLQNNVDLILMNVVEPSVNNK